MSRKTRRLIEAAVDTVFCVGAMFGLTYVVCWTMNAILRAVGVA